MVNFIEGHFEHHLAVRLKECRATASHSMVPLHQTLSSLKCVFTGYRLDPESDVCL